MARRAFLAPEVLQISSMDCGVAAVSCVLSGFGITANYEKLREACQTHVDGTSIDALEDLCGELGVDLTQHIVPPDLIVEAMRNRMPLIALQAPQVGVLHYVAVWRQVGDRLQIMDPRGGRVWKKISDFELTLHRHVQYMPLEDWKEWFATSSFFEAIQARAKSLLSNRVLAATCEPAFRAMDPTAIGAIDAALRLVRKTVDVVGSKTEGWRDALFQRSLEVALQQGKEGLPAPLWAIELDGDEVAVGGAVFLATPSPFAETAQAKISDSGRSNRFGGKARASLVQSIMEVLGPEAKPIIMRLFLGLFALALASGIELLVYRVAPLLPQLVGPVSSRLWLSGAVVFLLVVLLGLEGLTTYVAIRLGRTMELKLRANTLWALPRVDDEFVKSRPTSDLAYRAHSLSMGALLLPSLVTVVRAAGDLAVTLVAMAFLDVRYSIVVFFGAILFVLAWSTSRSRLQEVDTRLQVHASRLLAILFDALRGIRPVRLHGYQDALRDDQRREIAHWQASARAEVQATSGLQARYSTLAVLLVGTLFVIFLHRQGDARQFVLLSFWSFRIPPIILRLVQFAQNYPLQRNAMDRLLEVTRYAPTNTNDSSSSDDFQDHRGVSVRLENVSVMLGGQSVLEDIHLDIPAGQHVAVVGASGSGKSTLVALLLGIYKPSQGRVVVDGVPLEGSALQTLRNETAWIDPAVQLWNDTLGANLDYASTGFRRRNALEVLEASDMLGVLAAVERGLDTPLGAEGAFVSGGEGQRIRVGRALFRAGTRLVLLDEPFRGLDRTSRRRVMSNVRRMSLRSTLLFVSHDIEHVMQFDRVLVVDGGRIVEDGSPQELSAQDTRFARLLAAEKEVLGSAWSGLRWRRLRVENAKIFEVENRA